MKLSPSHQTPACATIEPHKEPPVEHVSTANFSKNIKLKDMATSPNSSVLMNTRRFSNPMSSQVSAFGEVNTHEESLSPDQTPSLAATPAGKKAGLRTRIEVSKTSEAFMSEVMKPLTDEERQNWQGWVELESEPDHFSFILRQYGVKGIKVQEIYGLFDEALDQLPKPVYGLIFLFRYREAEETIGDDVTKCPNHIWFANQTINNACATIALLNIIMNVPNLHIGEALEAFKVETQQLKPPYRGQRLGENGFIRNIHNSFARRMDMLNCDLALLNDAEKWERAKKNKKRKRSSQKKGVKEMDDAGFHFIAYVPIEGQVWRLDGLQRTPLNIGACGDHWISVAKDHISMHMTDNDVNYNLLSLCRSPLSTLPEEIVESIKLTMAVEDALRAIDPNWRTFVEDNGLTGLDLHPNTSFSITQHIIDTINISESNQRSLRKAETDAVKLMTIYERCLENQQRLQSLFMNEAALVGQQDEQAKKRKHDHTSAIYDSVKTLAENGVLKGVIQQLRGNDG